MGNTAIKINLPASKSIVNRLLIIEKLSGEKILNKKDISCDDTKVLSQVLSLENEEIFINNSGTAMRFMAAFLSQQKGNFILNGSKSIQKRPIGELVDLLRTLGANIEYCGKENFLPIKILNQEPRAKSQDTIHYSLFTNHCLQSSQTISALMLIAPYFENGLTINFQKISSFPYVLLTKKIMGNCGAEVQITDNQIIISNKKYFSEPRTKNQEPRQVEADWDCAAVWFAALAIAQCADSTQMTQIKQINADIKICENLKNLRHLRAKKIVLTNLFSDSHQPDSIVKNIFEKNFGIKSYFEKNNLILEKENNNNNVFNFDFENYPDLVPIVAVTCCALGKKFNFSGVKNLRIKESNRLDTLQNELKKCGFLLTQTENSLQWNGEKCPAETLPRIETYNDHRIAMAFAVLLQKIDLQILNPNVVEKSYKNFWSDFVKIV